MADEPTFPLQLADICFAAADLVLEPIAAPSKPDADPEPQWACEQRMWAQERGTTEPTDWVTTASTTYVIEAAHQVRAIGVLLASGAVTASLDPLERAVVERIGRVKWILHPSIYPDKRGARAGLEFGVSMSAYRLTLERLGAPNCKDWQQRVRAHRARLEELFAIDKPPSDPCEPGSKPTADMRQWVVAGEVYPNYGTIAGYALKTEETTHAQGKAMYDGMSGF